MSDHRDRVLEALARWGQEFDSENHHDDDIVLILGCMVVSVGDLRFARIQYESRHREITAAFAAALRKLA